MKKKTSIREVRMQMEAQKKAKFKAADDEKKRLAQEAEARKQAESEAKKKAAEKAKDEEVVRRLSKEKGFIPEGKSRAKATGVKSTFTVAPNTLVMTSFGRGNDAVAEKRIVGMDVTDLNDSPALEVAPEEILLQVSGRVGKASTDNPLHKAPVSSKDGEDLIHCRSALEKRYFGSNFEDNIHIQLIYSILDIEKILMVHINNIVYELNNLLRMEGTEHDDLIGRLSDGRFKSYADLCAKAEKNTTDATVRKMFDRLCGQRQLGYFGIGVDLPPRNEPGKKPPKKDPAVLLFTQDEFLSVLGLLGSTRQMLAHADGKNQKKIYSTASVSPVVHQIFSNRVQKLNDGFLKTAAKDLVIMFRAFDVKTVSEKRNYVRDYYDFVITKNYKNIGFSIKRLRELMTETVEEALVIRERKYDSVRQKLNRFFDFAVFRYYRTHEEESARLVNELRGCMNEQDKLRVYIRESRQLWEEIRVTVLEHILPQMSGDMIKYIDSNGDPDVNASMLEGILVSAEASGFVELIYLLTIFQDGKEINDLLTTLVNQFENIESFRDVLSKIGLGCTFMPDYQLFNDSKKIAGELRVVNSFARMAQSSPQAKQAMFVEAAKMLGYPRSEEELLKYLDEEMLSKKSAYSGKKETGFRNFIARNVIESDRFKYLVRYCSPAKVRKLAENRAVVSFVLKDIPEKQIVRYYHACTGETGEFSETMRERLADRITGLSFEEFADVHQDDRTATPQQAADKVRKQAAVRMYLVVLYLLIKNLVYINSRYFLAFHCVERDYILYTGGHGKRDDLKDDYALFAKKFLEEHPGKKRTYTYLMQNFANSDEWAVKTFRNKVAHLDAVRNASDYIGDIRTFTSYFELYHYLLQRTIMNQYRYDVQTPSAKNPGSMILDSATVNPKLLIYFELVSKYRTCCMDLTKALNVPFAYNLPRYKNLSIDGLFDRNRPGTVKCVQATEKESEA